MKVVGRACLDLLLIAMRLLTTLSHQSQSKPRLIVIMNLTAKLEIIYGHCAQCVGLSKYQMSVLLLAAPCLLLYTRNSSGDEIANVNFLYDDIVYVGLLQNTIDSCINSTTDRRGYVLERMFTKFSEITQYNGHYAIQGHSRSPISVPIESSCTTSY